MIRGGTSAAGKTGAIRTGYTQFFIPCELFAYSKSVQEKLETRGKAASYRALVKIENLAGEEQILTSCSYFQVQKYFSSGVDNAFVTIQRPEVWSIWGNQYTNLLKPSKRTITILAGLLGEEIPIFKGRIVGMAEVQGGPGGAINLTCNDHRITLQRTRPEALALPHSRYCEVHRLANPTFKEAKQVLTVADSDTSGVFTPIIDNLKSVAQALSGDALWCSGEVMAVGTGGGLQVLGDDVLLIDDAAIITATRDFYDSSAFNTVNIKGLDSEGEVITETILDETDADERGTVAYGTVVGTDKDSIESVRALAVEMIAKSLAGRLQASIVFNPYLVPGQIVKFSSNRFKIALTTATIKSVRHQYQYGDCGTWLDGLEIAS